MLVLMGVPILQGTLYTKIYINIFKPIIRLTSLPLKLIGAVRIQNQEKSDRVESPHWSNFPCCFWNVHHCSPWTLKWRWNLSLCFDQTRRNHKLDTNQINVVAGTGSFGQQKSEKGQLDDRESTPKKKICMTMENPPFEGLFSHWKWGFSNVMLVFRGVNQFPLKLWLKQLLLKAIGRLQSNWWHIRVASMMSRWWFQIFSIFTLFGEDSQFD